MTRQKLSSQPLEQQHARVEMWEAARQQPDAFIITGANVTSYWTCEAIAMDMPGDIFAFKEHGIPSRSAEAAQAVAYQQGFGLVAGPLDETGRAQRADKRTRA